MALKTEKTPEPPATTAAPPATDIPVAQTTVLELALYKNYTWGKYTYEQGKPYRFKNADAMLLLAEQDTGRPVWKLYKPARPKQAPKTEIVDATMISAPVPVDAYGDAAPVADPKKRIDIGDDSEISDILNKDGDITV